MQLGVLVCQCQIMQSWFCIDLESWKEVAGGFLRVVLSGNIWIRKAMEDSTARTRGGKDAACASGSGTWELQRWWLVGEWDWEDRDFSSQLQVVQRIGAEEYFSVWPCFPAPNYTFLAMLSRTGAPSGCRCGSCSWAAVLKCFYGRERRGENVSLLVGRKEYTGKSWRTSDWGNWSASGVQCGALKIVSVSQPELQYQFIDTWKNRWAFRIHVAFN